MNRELFVKKKRVYKKNPAPFEWEHGSYMGGEVIDDAWVYYCLLYTSDAADE